MTAHTFDINAFSMKRRLLLAVVAVVAGILMAIFLAARSSTQKEAKSELARRFAVEASDVRFEPQRSRGVICGRFRTKKDAAAGDWRRFVYVSHYSAGAPERSELTLETDPTARDLFSRFGCQ